MDWIKGNKAELITQNSYIYAVNNPKIYVDFDGMEIVNIELVGEDGNIINDCKYYVSDKNIKYNNETELINISVISETSGRELSNTWYYMPKETEISVPRINFDKTSLAANTIITTVNVATLPKDEIIGSSVKIIESNVSVAKGCKMAGGIVSAVDIGIDSYNGYNKYPNASEEQKKSIAIVDGSISTGTILTATAFGGFASTSLEAVFVVPPAVPIILGAVATVGAGLLLDFLLCDYEMKNGKTVQETLEDWVWEIRNANKTYE